MYIYPTDVSESEKGSGRVFVNENIIELKTYGLPFIFWGYFAAILIVILAMYLVIASPLKKLIEMGDSINIVLAYAVYATLIVIPLSCLILLFLEKRMIKKEDAIILKTYLGPIPLYTKTIKLKNNSGQSFIIKHYLESPNVAKLKSDNNLRGFENKGYYELYVLNQNDESIRIDRHSRRVDLVKLKDLLLKY